MMRENNGIALHPDPALATLMKRSSTCFAFLLALGGVS
jgi:hypothetical protein